MFVIVEVRRSSTALEEEEESCWVGAPVRLKREILSEEEPAFAARMSPDLGARCSVGPMAGVRGRWDSAGLLGERACECECECGGEWGCEALGGCVLELCGMVR